MVLGGLWAFTGVYVFAQPQAFYDMVPGLALMGPFSIHFIRDVGLAFLSSGAITILGGYHTRRDLALAGALWPSLHALFHVQIWSHRGFPFDAIFFFDLLAVISPALLAVACAWRLGSLRAPA
jgi:hypothetical protein